MHLLDAVWGLSNKNLPSKTFGSFESSQFCSHCALKMDLLQTSHEVYNNNINVVLLIQTME